MDSKIFINFDLFFKLLIRVFVPLIVFVIILGIILKLYCAKRKNKDREKYIRRSNIISLLFASLITFILLIINILFSFNFINEIKINSLISGNEIIYYGVMISPIIPFLCFIFYFISLLKTMFIDKPHKKEEIEEEKFNEDGIEIL